MKKISLLMMSTLISVLSYTQSGQLDPTFGVNNLFLTQFQGPVVSTCNKQKVLPDDKILGVGYVHSTDANVFLFRLNPNGTYDTTFGNMGKLELDPSLGGADLGYDVEVLPSGKFLITVITGFNTEYESRIIMLTPDGNIDDTFGNLGVVYYKHNNQSTHLHNVEVDSQGRIIWGGMYENNGTYRWLLIRLNPDGSFDNSFSTDGIQEIVNIQNGGNEYVQTLCLASDNSIFVSGKNMPANNEETIIVTKVSPSGNVDISYGTQGRYFRTLPMGVSGAVYTMSLGSNGEILYTGAEGNKAILCKITAQGTPDMSFGNAGVVVNLNANLFIGLKQLNADKIAVLGTHVQSDNVLIAVYNGDGTLNTNFGNQGEAMHLLHPDVIYCYGYHIETQTSGNLIITGNLILSSDPDPTQIFAARILNPGYFSVDENITTVGCMLYPNPASTYFTVDVVSGSHIQKINLLDLFGRVIYTWTGSQTQYDLPENDLSGTYFIQVHTDNGTTNKTIVINK